MPFEGHSNRDAYDEEATPFSFELEAAAARKPVENQATPRLRRIVQPSVCTYKREIGEDTEGNINGGSLPPMTSKQAKRIARARIRQWE